MLKDLPGSLCVAFPSRLTFATVVRTLVSPITVPAAVNNAPGVGQTACNVADPVSQIPTDSSPLQQCQLQETFFGSAPVGGLNLFKSEKPQAGQLLNLKIHSIHLFAFCVNA